MSRITPLPFQQRHIDALAERFIANRNNYNALTNPAELQKLRLAQAGIMLQAPTGIGKTLIATELVSRFSKEDRVVWLWFAPFAGLVSQAENSLRTQATQLQILNIDYQRSVDELASGSVFVLTWQTVAAKTQHSRLVRRRGDAGMALDDLILVARQQGFRIGVVVDEAHHGFVKAKEACRFFTDVIAPDYALLMTATPRDTDVARFAEQTGYQIGSPEEWAAITREEGRQAGLLKLGIKTARFIARNEDDAQLVSLEEVALSECAVMHRHIKQTLADAGVSLTPLMLVQVPNGKEAIENARRYLVDTLKFPEDAVRVHVADEPDPHILALAHDPQVEVIIFKMAIAMGFDAPRAFTLAALRGTRDVNFGIQVVGRIMRVHAALQRRPDTPSVLSYGYVYLANNEAQEGLSNAARAINAVTGRTIDTVPETVVTFVNDSSFVQVARDGEPLSLFPTGPAPTDIAQPLLSQPPFPDYPQPTEQTTLFESLTYDHLAHGETASSHLAQAFTLETQQEYKYELKADCRKSLETEVLPQVPDDFALRIVTFIDFSSVLTDRDRTRTQLVKRTSEIFSGSTPDDEDVWAKMSPAGIAAKARQIAFEFPDVDRRHFLAALKLRFKEALEKGGYELPSDDEALTQQMELVLVRNPKLIRQAHKRCRADQITTAHVQLPGALVSDFPLERAKRNIYGVIPAELSPDERRFAELLDTSPDVLWWHRNPSQKPSSVALYKWSAGRGFFPDFVIAINSRTTGDGIALVEFKGPHLQQYDKEKAAATHPLYGRVFMVGPIAGNQRELRLFRLAGDELVDDGLFEVTRLRYD